MCVCVFTLLREYTFQMYEREREREVQCYEFVCVCVSQQPYVERVGNGYTIVESDGTVENMCWERYDRSFCLIFKLNFFLVCAGKNKLHIYRIHSRRVE